MAGPLHGMKVVELAGLGAAPFCGMVLADLGADVIRVSRVGDDIAGPASVVGPDQLDRGKRSIGVDLKRDDGVEVVLRMAAGAEALIEGFRPGVTERLGLGPAECLAHNRALVYGRMTGWGQTGPYASMAGHDINYIALAGVLHAVGPEERPIPPLNLVGDFGGGGMLLALGVVSAVLHARETGVGQVVDASMVEGAALLMTSHHGLMAEGWWTELRESNLLDGAAPFYTTYQTADGGHVAVGALEPRFFATLLDGLGVSSDEIPDQYDRDGWPQIRATLAARFRERTRDEWARHFEGSDACVAPVLSMAEAPFHRHNRERGTFIEVNGVTQPAPAPRFSGTPSDLTAPPRTVGADTDLVLGSLGYKPEEISKLRATGAVG